MASDTPVEFDNDGIYFANNQFSVYLRIGLFISFGGL